VRAESESSPPDVGGGGGGEVRRVTIRCRAAGEGREGRVGMWSVVRERDHRHVCRAGTQPGARAHLGNEDACWSAGGPRSTSPM